MDNLFAKVGGWRSGTGIKFVTRSGKTSDPTKRTIGSTFSGTNAPDRTPTKTPGWTFLRLFVIIWLSTTSTSVTGNSSTFFAYHEVPGRFTGITTRSVDYVARGLTPLSQPVTPSNRSKGWMLVANASCSVDS